MNENRKVWLTTLVIVEDQWVANTQESISDVSRGRSLGFLLITFRENRLPEWKSKRNEYINFVQL